MEFAVIKTGGKQYKVATGDMLKIEKIKTADKRTFAVGDKIVFDEVMLTSNGTADVIGTPFITGGKVEAVLEEVGRNKTVDVIKYKQKSRYFKKNGHRQPWFKVRIGKIA